MSANEVSESSSRRETSSFSIKVPCCVYFWRKPCEATNEAINSIKKCKCFFVDWVLGAEALLFCLRVVKDIDIHLEKLPEIDSSLRILWISSSIAAGCLLIFSFWFYGGSRNSRGVKIFICSASFLLVVTHQYLSIVIALILIPDRNIPLKYFLMIILVGICILLQMIKGNLVHLMVISSMIHESKKRYFACVATFTRVLVLIAIPLLYFGAIALTFTFGSEVKGMWILLCVTHASGHSSFLDSLKYLNIHSLHRQEHIFESGLIDYCKSFILRHIYLLSFYVITSSLLLIYHTSNDKTMNDESIDSGYTNELNRMLYSMLHLTFSSILHNICVSALIDHRTSQNQKTISDPEDSAKETEKRLDAVEGELLGHDTRLNELQTRVNNLERVIDRIEAAAVDSGKEHQSVEKQQNISSKAGT